MAAIQHISPFWFVPTHLQRISKTSVCTKLFRDGFKPERLIGVATDGYKDSRTELDRLIYKF